MLKPADTGSFYSIVQINVGGLMDIPTGHSEIGPNGEHVWIGGIAPTALFAGPANTGKSVIAEGYILSGMNRLSETFLDVYDTEDNKTANRYIALSKDLDKYKTFNIIEQNEIRILKKSNCYADEWWSMKKEYYKDKTDKKQGMTTTYPILDRRTKSALKTWMPTFSLIDSLTEFETQVTANKNEDSKMGDSEGNMIHAQAGLHKTRYFMELPRHAINSMDFSVFTSHFGKNMAVGGGPFAPQPEKKMPTMKAGEKITGLPPKGYYLLHHAWFVNSKHLNKKGATTPEYPIDAKDDDKDNVDLRIANLYMLRSKTGPSDFEINVIFSQSEGLLLSLSEFHYIRSDSSYFGLVGGTSVYSCIIYPEVKISRVTVRQKLKSDPKLERAVNILSELAQLKQFHGNYYEDLWCTPEQLYEGVKNNGQQYGITWDFILSKTRGWYVPDNDKHQLKYLSIIDLLHLAKNGKKPYWA